MWVGLSGFDSIKLGENTKWLLIVKKHIEKQWVSNFKNYEGKWILEFQYRYNYHIIPHKLRDIYIMELSIN